MPYLPYDYQKRRLKDAAKELSSMPTLPPHTLTMYTLHLSDDGGPDYSKRVSNASHSLATAELHLALDLIWIRSGAYLSIVCPSPSAWGAISSPVQNHRRISSLQQRYPLHQLSDRREPLRQKKVSRRPVSI
ncbi:hypothetical protein BC936DRAFT_147290 [Jimgerdemannia flammicorona]|uniref:Uncharacterized protein n=2 Tax=Jimgerdemannia flammicorona TaxID=994334 RepID=A0A433QN54_9FUNG|nr:hypothetical protein BC936DRAFT_147290 [Jimgerdemannia flammicorona]RUS31205.1 hypothetical protein BC938DRAFT_478264 [Jimgerdemannia flammicorona]